MVNVHQLISFLPWLSGQSTLQTGRHEFGHAQSVLTTATTQPEYKSIAIIGAGSSGLSSLKTFLDVAETTGQNWEIVVFEKRDNVGGVWLYENSKPEPPEIPETPAYKELRTNVPHPYMTYPNLPLPPMTDLLAKYSAIQQYHSDFVSLYNLAPYIRLNHNVTAASWIGNSTKGLWNLTYTFQHEPDTESQISYKLFDHLLVATGTDHYPRTPTWPGVDDWLSGTSSNGVRHEMLHSIYWDGSEAYTNRTVLVVGAAASGADIVLHTAPVTEKIYWSVNNYTGFVKMVVPRLPPWHEIRPIISHFTADTVFFHDGSNCSDVDAIILATGYEKRIPFLEETGLLHVIPSANSNDTYSLGLVTNLRYIFPLHEHMLPVVPQLPTNALGIIGIIENGLRFRISVAQSLYLAYSIIDPSILPSREDMLHGIYLREEHYRDLGYDEYRKGHFLLDDRGSHPGSGFIGYMDSLVKYLKDREVIPNDGKNFTPPWITERVPELQKTVSNWLDIMKMGTEKDWLSGVKTEDEWSDLMHRVSEWKNNSEVCTSIGS